MFSEAKYDDGVYEERHLIKFSDGRVATKVGSIPPGETRWGLITEGDPTSGVGVVCSLPSNSQGEIVLPGSTVRFSGGTDTNPPTFSAFISTS